MNKKETITAVIDAFDEIDRLRMENASLRASREKERPAYKDAIYEYGRAEIFERAAPFIDPGERTIDDWFRSFFHNFPDFMSRDEFRAEYDREIADLYRQRLTEGTC